MISAQYRKKLENINGPTHESISREVVVLCLPATIDATPSRSNHHGNSSTYMDTDRPGNDSRHFT